MSTTFKAGSRRSIDLCKVSILFDLVSYCDMRVQSNPFISKETSVY